MSSVHVVGRSRDLEPSSSTTSLLGAAGLPHGNLPEPQAAALSGPPSQVTQGRIARENPNHTRSRVCFTKMAQHQLGGGMAEATDTVTSSLCLLRYLRASVQQKVQMGKPQVGAAVEPVSLPRHQARPTRR